MKQITVSGAIILRSNPLTHQKEIFATQRGYGDWKGWWEFPGGKLESGETPQQCIVREIREELATEVKAEEILGVVEYDYPDFHLTMHCILCTIVSGNLQLLEHDSAKWLNKETLWSVNWLPADKEILAEVENLLASQEEGKILTNAQKKQDELNAIILNSSEIKNQRPLFHFSTPGGWCNDPNGFSQFGEKIHLFYQYHPYSTQWGPMHWGHVTSDDMLNWELQPVALAPDSSADYKGCFSGTGIEHEGKHILAYTGVTNNGAVDIQNQCIAIGDGCVYEKMSENPVVTASNIPFEYNIEHFRDPKIWKKDDQFYMVCVLKQKNNRGAMVMFQSKDAKIWTYKGILDSSKDGLSNMWECPDVSVIDGKDVLIFSPQEVQENDELGFHNGNNSIYVTGTLDYENCKFIRETRPENGYTAALVDYGIDFYAPETTKLKDGRTIMIGWMQAWESYITPKNYIWSGMMTLPRELSFKNNRLYQQPVRELEKWKADKREGIISAGTDLTEIASKVERHFEIDLNLNDAKGTVKLILGDAEEKVILEVNTDEAFISFDRTQTSNPGAIPFRKAKLRIQNELKNLKIICDTCSLEVFINDGIMTFTNIFFFEKSFSNFNVKNDASQNITYDFWKIIPNS